MSHILFSAHFKALKHLETKSLVFLTFPWFQKGIIHYHSLLWPWSHDPYGLGEEEAWQSYPYSRRGPLKLCPSACFAMFKVLQNKIKLKVYWAGYYIYSIRRSAVKTQEGYYRIKISEKSTALFDYKRNFVILLNRPDLLKTGFIN